MRGSLQRSLFRMASLGALVVVLLGAAVPGAPAASTGSHVTKPCTALGTYAVNKLPVSSNNPPPTDPGTAQTYPTLVSGYLSGTLTLTGYTGCGTPTAGTFAVHAVFRTFPGPQPQSSSGPRPGIVAVPLFNTSVLTATGTIAQDPAHASDPTFLAVTASVTYGRRNLCATVCARARGSQGVACPAVGCAMATVVTRVAAFGSVSGFLRFQDGSPASVGLVFLPPPDPGAKTASAALTVQPISFVGVQTGS